MSTVQAEDAPGNPPATLTDAAPAPIAPAQRLQSLDVLRGAALLGIFMVNMPFFAMPFMLAMYDPSLADGALSEQLSHAFVKTFFEYKFISLFSLLFGAGFIMQVSRADAAGGNYLPKYLRRTAALFMIGLIHALLLWYGDILLIYSVTGLLLLLAARQSARTLLILSVVTLAISAALVTGWAAVQYLAIHFQGTEQAEAHAAAEAAIAAGEAPVGLEALLKAQFDPANPYWQHAELRAYRDGPISDALSFRAVSYAWNLLFTVFGYGWHVLSMFLLGAALMKWNFFSPACRTCHRRCLFVALPIGLLLEGVPAAAILMGADPLSLPMLFLTPLREFSSVLLMLGYVGALCLLVHSHRCTAITRPIAATGRMALSVYLAETIIATSLMYWWGLAWFGSLSRLELIGLVFAIYALLVVASVLWLRAFRFGPMEWLWRSATYLRLQPMRD